MAHDSKQAMVERYFQAVSRQDAQELAELFAPDGVMEDPVGARPITDADGFERFITGITDTFEAMVLTPGDSFHAGDEVAVRWSARGRSKGGVDVSYGGIDVFAFDDEDRITSMKGYWHPRELFAQLRSA